MEAGTDSHHYIDWDIPCFDLLSFCLNWVMMFCSLALLLISVLVLFEINDSMKNTRRYIYIVLVLVVHTFNHGTREVEVGRFL